MAAKKPDFFTWLRSQLRKISRRHPPIYEALAKAKVKYVGNNPRQKYAYICAKCGGSFSAKEVSVDHIVDCGTLKSWDDVQEFMQRLFCSADELQVLCHPDHDIKTYMAKHNVDEEEAIVQKMTIAILKENPQDVLDFIESYDYNGTYQVNNAVNRRKAVEDILRNVT